ncbi:MAG: VWA domain-containing protein [Nanoarchaeota archaeon]|nr:VWA domain-containing protein [Nanoarchaeota archaeon]
MRKKRAMKFVNFDAVARIKGIEIYSKNITSLVMTLCILILLIFSIAGPTLEYEASTSSVAFIVAIDNSRSMEAQDFPPNRLEAAKKSAILFSSSLPAGTSMGVISFSGNSVIEQAVTRDRLLIERAISSLEFSSIGGTDTIEAVRVGTDMLNKYPKKAVVIISDGQLNVGTIEQAIDYAKEREVIVHTIAVGTKGGGQTSYGLSQVDEDSLRSLAYNTGGSFFFVSEERELSLSLRKIAEVKPGIVAMSLINYLLLISIILLFIKYALVNARLMEFP